MADQHECSGQNNVERADGTTARRGSGKVISGVLSDNDPTPGKKRMKPGRNVELAPMR